jgi:hypothetical protein
MVAAAHRSSRSHSPGDSGRLSTRRGHTAAEDLLEIVMRRYEHFSTLLTSNRTVGDWGKLLGDVAAVSAMLDRLLHHGPPPEVRPAQLAHQNRRHHTIRKRASLMARVLRFAFPDALPGGRQFSTSVSIFGVFRCFDLTFKIFKTGNNQVSCL